MKKLKINEKLKQQIIAGGLCSSLLLTGCSISNSNNKESNEKDIDNEQVIEEIQSNRTFDISKLCVIDRCWSKNAESELLGPYIVYLDENNTNVCYEYHNMFQASFYFFGCHSDEWICDCDYHYNEITPLLNYLTNDEFDHIASNLGNVTITDVDKIYVRIRNEYQEQNSEQLAK